MDKNFVKTLNVIEIEVVIIKGKIPGVKKKVELVMDPEVFQEWRDKIATQETNNKLSFAEAFKSEFNKFFMIFKKK